MQTSKRGAILILICCSIVLVSYTYYKRQYIINATAPVIIYKAPSPQQNQDTTITLSVGQTLQTNGMAVTLSSITNDSRCPVDVSCLQAGTVNAHVTIVFPKETKTMDLSLHVPVDFGDYDVTVTQVTPMKHSKQEIKARDYKVTFLISKISEVEKQKRHINAIR